MSIWNDIKGFFGFSDETSRASEKTTRYGSALAAFKPVTQKIYANKYDARSIRARTLQGVINSNREKQAIEQDTRHIGDLCRSFTDMVIERIDECVAKTADEGRFSFDVEITRYEGWHDRDESRVWDGCFSTLYIELRKEAAGHKFSSPEQRQAYGDELVSIITQYYEDMGFRVTSYGWKKCEEVTGNCYDKRNEIKISWLDEEMKKYGRKVTDEIEVEAYARGLCLHDIMCGK